jgi:predicted DsbA family dithiol-disulfide isomerase
MARRVQDDVEDAAKANGQGTPYTVILGPRGQVVPFSGAQPYENLRSVIDALIGTP